MYARSVAVAGWSHNRWYSLNVSGTYPSNRVASSCTVQFYFNVLCYVHMLLSCSCAKNMSLTWISYRKRRSALSIQIGGKQIADINSRRGHFPRWKISKNPTEKLQNGVLLSADKEPEMIEAVSFKLIGTVGHQAHETCRKRPSHSNYFCDMSLWWRHRSLNDPATVSLNPITDKPCLLLPIADAD